VFKFIGAILGYFFLGKNFFGAMIGFFIGTVIENFSKIRKQITSNGGTTEDVFKYYHNIFEYIIAK
jgi:hypothetical protein